MKKGIIIAVIVVVALVAVISVLVLSGDDKNDSTSTTPSTSDSTGTDSTGSSNSSQPSAPSDGTASTGTGDNSNTPASTNKVAITDFAFSPATLTVKKGTTVTWTNNDSVAHTVTGDNGGPSSGNLEKGDTYSFTFNTAGTFKYHCTPHPNMTASVTVTE